MSHYFKFLLLILVLAQITGCKEPYEPSLKAVKSGYLVVDGMIINGRSMTTINLTRTTGLHDTVNIIYEDNAIVQIEGEDNSVFTLTAKVNGQYIADSLNLNTNILYRLRIKTKNGSTYTSDFVPVLNTPPIDSVSWTQYPDSKYPHVKNLSIFVNTHDPENKTRYYLWNYDETWKYHSPIIAYVKDSANKVFRISTAEREKLYYCWQSSKSKSILIGNSVKLSQDVISMKQLTAIEGNLIKKSFIYSINVKQFALTRQAYEFFEIMKKNSEQTGSLFDPQPSEITGNIKNTIDPSEPVIGFVGIATLSEKRIFINDRLFYYYPASCVVTSLYDLDVSKINYPSNYPVNFITPPGSEEILGYTIAPSGCVNCEQLGGKNERPVFWPDSL